MIGCLWSYRARVVRVVDGDTVIAELDTGFHSYRWEKLRLLGIDCPEVVGEYKAAGLAAKAFVEEWVRGASGDWPFFVRTYKSDSFGRYLAEVWRSDGSVLVEALLLAGHGAPA